VWVAAETPFLLARATVGHRSPMWVEYMQRAGSDSEWNNVVSDIEYVLNDGSEDLEWLGPVKLTVVTHHDQLKVALKRLRQSCKGTDTLSSIF
jgi:hypothetical protein